MSDSEFNIRDIMKHYEDTQRETERRAMNLRDGVMKILNDGGVKSVTVGFDGYGDSGDIGGMVASPAAGEALLEVSLPGTKHKKIEWVDGKPVSGERDRTVREAIAEIAYALLGNHPGWEINDGSCGEFVFLPKTNEINLTFNQRVESYETSEETY